MLLPSDPSFRVTVRALTKSYGDSLVLDHVSLDLESGCPCCLMAPSGAGKTTLFRILMGLETADSGTIEGLEGRSFSAVFQEDQACLRDTPPSRISASSPAAGILPMN